MDLHNSSQPNATGSLSLCPKNTSLKLVHSAIGAIAVVTNALILVVHYRFPVVRGSLHLIPAVAVSDLVMGVAQLIEAATLSFCQFTFTRLECFLLKVPFLYAARSNAAFMLLLSGYRMLCYKKPVLAKRLDRVAWVVAAYGFGIGYFLFGLILHLLMIPLEGKIRQCTIQAVVAVFFSGKVLLIGTLLISLAITIINVLFYREVRSRVKKVGTERGHGVEGIARLRDARMAESILIVSTIYVVTWFTGFLLRSLVVNVGDPYLQTSFGPYITVLMSINCVTNFFVYASRSADYRRAFQRLAEGSTRVPAETN